ncbi:transposase, partial [Candidatus Chloroploca sp. M-50]
MRNPITLLVCLAPFVRLTTIRQLSRISQAILAMTGRVTMQGMARWSSTGGSYRTIQRFFATVLPWELLFWVFFRTHLHDPDDVYLVGGDETVVSKAGKQTHGLDRFFSSLAGKPVPGLAFFTLSLISVKQRRSFPIQVAQLFRARGEPASVPDATPPPVEPAPKRKPGRPRKDATPPPVD